MSWRMPGLAAWIMLAGCGTIHVFERVQCIEYPASEAQYIYGGLSGPCPAPYEVRCDLPEARDFRVYVADAEDCEEL